MNISDPPLTYSGNTNHEVESKRGETVILDCNVCAYPAVEDYNWVFNEQTISNDRMCTLRNIDENDYGKYTCHVCNNVGCMEYHYSIIAIGKYYEF